MPPRERHKRKRSKLRHSRDISLPPLASWATIRKLNHKGRLIMALPVSLQLRYWGVAAVALGLVLWFLGDTLLPFILGGAIAYLLDPIADRMERWANAVGRENVLFGNDCGFASTAGNAEIPPSVAWAKLAALGDGAKLATLRLWK